MAAQNRRATRRRARPSSRWRTSSSSRSATSSLAERSSRPSPSAASRRAPDAADGKVLSVGAERLDRLHRHRAAQRPAAGHALRGILRPAENGELVKAGAWSRCASCRTTSRWSGPWRAESARPDPAGRPRAQPALRPHARHAPLPARRLPAHDEQGVRRRRGWASWARPSTRRSAPRPTSRAGERPLGEADAQDLTETDEYKLADQTSGCASFG
jgi:hypothetical protein